MKKNFKKILLIIISLFALFTIPIFSIIEELYRAFKNMHIFKNISNKYKYSFTTFKVNWKHDFNQEKILEEKKQEILDRIHNN